MEKPHLVGAIEVAPGKYVQAPAQMPAGLPTTPANESGSEGPPRRFMIAEIVPVGGGTFRLLPRPMIEWVGLSRNALAKVGITVSPSTMRRLGRGGFVRIRATSPSIYEVNFQSWLDHCARVEENPEEFWDMPTTSLTGRTGFSNRQKYSQTV